MKKKGGELFGLLGKFLVKFGELGEPRKREGLCRGGKVPFVFLKRA